MKKIFSSILISFILFTNLVLPISVFASNVSLINKNVPLNLYQYDTLNFGGKYYDFTFTFKIADNPPEMGSLEQVNAIVYFEADINGQSVSLDSAILKSGEGEIPAKTAYNNRVMYVTNMIASDYKGKTIERTVRIPMALLFSITKENNVPFHWKIYNGDKYDEIYASGTIKLADNPVAVTPKINVATNNSIYKMLAPIGGIERMDSSGTDPTCAADPKCITNDIGKYLNIIFKLAIGICAALAVIMLIINGVKYMGDESVFGKTEAKKQMFGAIVGLLIALGAWALLNTINPALTGQNGLSISSANIEIENEPVPWSTYEKGDNKNACPSGYVDVATGATPASINVCSTISKNLSDLIAAAKKDGYTLSGTGSRSIATTQALRVKNSCPDPKTPSNQCKPNAVAIPGNSNHEKGLAVDFNCNGKSMQPDKINTNNVCYVWLTKNASTYSFKNNFSALQETWHWSTTGN